jgi:hypothetical protein
MIDGTEDSSGGEQSTNGVQITSTGPATSIPSADRRQPNLKNELTQTESNLVTNASVGRHELLQSVDDDLESPRKLLGRTQLAQLEHNVEIKTRFRSSSLDSVLKRMKQSRREASCTSNDKSDLRPQTLRMEDKVLAKVRSASTSCTIEITGGIIQAIDNVVRDVASENDQQTMLNDSVQSFPSPPFEHDIDEDGSVPDVPACGTMDAGNDRDDCCELPPMISSTAAGIDNESELQHGHAQEESLAIAVAVTEYDAFIPAAFECEPQTKPPMYKNRRFRFYGAAITILLIAIVTSATYAALHINDSLTTGPPSSAPTTERAREGIVDRLIAIVGESNLLNPTSAQARAADWLINKDPMALDADADSLVQRYLLVLFYLSTTENRPWLSCNPPTGDSDDDCDFSRLVSGDPLGLFYANITWGRWLSGKNECEWAGIQCDEFNQTRSIDLSGQEIRGTLPTEIALVPYLESLTLFMNQLHGTLPSELASARHLLSIELNYNYFTGRIPPEWYNSVNFQRLNVAGNFITGTIPTEIGRLSTLKGFFIQENNFEGKIPSEIGQLTSLGKVMWKVSIELFCIELILTLTTTI